MSLRRSTGQPGAKERHERACIVGRTKMNRRRLILTPPMLDYLTQCCTNREMQMVEIDRFGQARIWMRQDVMLELIAMARFGTGLATLNAKPAAARSANAKKAATARWDRVRAQRTEAAVQARMLPY